MGASGVRLQSVFNPRGLAGTLHIEFCEAHRAAGLYCSLACELRDVQVTVKPKALDADDVEVEKIPVSPSTGLDSEIRSFMGRIMTGYESAHRTIAEMAEMMSKAAAESQAATVKAIRMQMQVADELEEIRSKKHKRELEAKAEEANRANRQALMQQGQVVLALAAKKWLGIPLTGDDSHGLQDLLKSMTPDQLDSLMQTGSIQLNDAQRQALMLSVASLGEAEAKKNGVEVEPPPTGEPS